jgi:hypothetical protein
MGRSASELCHAPLVIEHKAATKRLQVVVLVTGRYVSESKPAMKAYKLPWVLHRQPFGLTPQISHAHVPCIRRRNMHIMITELVAVSCVGMREPKLRNNRQARQTRKKRNCTTFPMQANAGYLNAHATSPDKNAAKPIHANVSTYIRPTAHSPCRTRQPLRAPP